MSDIAVKVENLSKIYRIGLKGKRHDTLGGEFLSWIKSPLSNYKHLKKLTSFKPDEDSEDVIWALRDVSFEVKQGEVLGIIGKNGAGKSTLLKILSSITEPTKGRVTINRRVASLLEIGTGFHFELTGRENIYLNGTILGMTKQEIDKKFDKIVDFSGVEKFIDTPIKRYSSGMTVRLAFAVAAHLEPEILIIDEVLAVGDAEFQQKCLGKMDNVAKSGRTVLFVSHNMMAIKALCPNTILLKEGKLVEIGDTKKVINEYLNVDEEIISTEIDLEEHPRESGKRDIIFKKALFNKNIFLPEDDIEIKLLLKPIEKNRVFKNISLSVFIVDINNNIIYHLSNEFLYNANINHDNKNTYSFNLLKNSLQSGSYKIRLWLGANGEEQDYISEGISIKIKEGNIYNYPNSRVVTGIVQPDFTFDIK